MKYLYFKFLKLLFPLRYKLKLREAYRYGLIKGTQKAKEEVNRIWSVK